MRRGPAIGVAVLGALAALGPTVAGADAATVSQTFTTAGEHPFVVPPGVMGVQATLVGGSGAAGSGGEPGGAGATVTANLTVSPGETLYVEVAGNGLPGSGMFNTGGYGGGGEGGYRAFLVSAPGGGGGGGASDVQRCSAGAAPSECDGGSPLASRLLVAGGGGGGGGSGLGSFTPIGGVGGAADQSGTGGHSDSHGDPGGSAGLRGTNAAGGAGGEPSAACGSGSSAIYCAASGQPGSGGVGGSAIAGGGGGGGGGIFGGGGGGGGQSADELGPPVVLYSGGGGGGGGGGSGVPADTTGVSGFSLVPTAEGAQPSATLTWTAPPPAVLTGAASAVTATTATLNGTVNPDAWQITTCDFDVSPAPAGIATFPCAQQLAANGTPSPVSATAGGLTPGTTYTVTLAASTVQGAGSGTPVTFTTPTASSASGTIGLGAPGNALTLTDVRLTPTRFRRGRRAASIAKAGVKALPGATTITYELSRAASVNVDFEASHAGVLAGHRCSVAAEPRRKGKRCTRYTAVSGHLTIAAHAGSDRITFDGALDGGRSLPPGSYRLSLSAISGSALARAAQRPSFTLLR